MIELKNISKIYRTNKGQFYALSDISMQIDEGEFIAICGSSGAGKSTLLFLAGGMIKPDEGFLFVDGKEIYKFSEKERNNYRKTNIGFIFQQFHLIPYLTVFENIKLGCNSHDDVQNIADLLKKCSLENKATQYPSQLSVGEKQRTAFIRAIVSNPEIILADEPTGNLDPENSRIIMNLLKEFNWMGGTVLVVTHDKETRDYAKRSIMLDNGKLLN